MVELSKRETRKQMVLQTIQSLPKGKEFCNYDIATIIAPEDKRQQANIRAFLSSFLKNLAAEGKIIKFVGWKESSAPVKRKVFRKV